MTTFERFGQFANSGGDRDLVLRDDLLGTAGRVSIPLPGLLGPLGLDPAIKLLWKSPPTGRCCSRKPHQ